MNNDNKDNKDYKTVTDIKKEYGCSFTEVCNKFLQDGYSISEIARILKLKAPSRVTCAIRSEAESKRRLENKLNKGNVNNIYSGLTPNEFESTFYKYTGIELEVFIKEKYLKEKWSIQELSEYFCKHRATIIKTMVIYGIEVRSYSKARTSAIEKGKINYAKINAKGRKSTLKARYNKVSNNYTPQEMLRDYIKDEIESYFVENNIRHFEIIIGYNSWGILFDFEVDIPIVAINYLNGKYKKFSIEYSGEIWHEVRKEADDKKKDRLLLRNWIHFEITEHRNNTNEDIINNAKDIANKIILLLKEIE